MGWDGIGIRFDGSRHGLGIDILRMGDLNRWQQMGIGMSVKHQREKVMHLQGACGRDLLQVF